MHTRKEIGAAGEEAVCTYLAQRGFTVLARNYTAPHGEIDIIAQDAKYIVFCEVKTRKESPLPARFGRPSSAVDRAKRAHLLDTARRYLKEHCGSDRPPDRQPRLDVAEVLYTEDGDRMHFRIRYIERAFGAGGGTRKETVHEAF